MIRSLRIGVRTWLLGLAAFASAPLFLFAAFSIYQLGHSERAAEARQLIQSGRAGAHAVAQRLNVSLGFLNALANSNAAKRGDIPALYEHSRQAIKLASDASAISLVDRQERLVFLTLRPLGTEGLPVADLESVRRVLQTGKPSISKPFKSPVNDKVVVAIGVPVVVADEVAYCIRLIVPAQILGAMLEEQRLADGWVSAIVGDDGVLLARSLFPERYVGQKASPSLLATMANPHSEVFETVTLDGVRSLTTVAQVPGWNLAVAIGVPMKILAADSTQAMYNLLGFGFVVVIASLIAATWLSRFIASQFRSVVDASLAQHRGEYHGSGKTGIREVDAVLQQMTTVTARELETKRTLEELAVQHQQIHHDLKSARKDALTQLPGRAEFVDLVEELHRKLLSSQDTQLMILFIDLDGFKGVNDQHGHAVGDDVLKQAANVLRKQTRDADVVGRIGGDEFVICLVAETTRAEHIAVDVAQRIVENIRSIGSGIGCSIGIAEWTAACPSLDCVMQQADDAMYEAKRRGKNQFVVSAG